MITVQTIVFTDFPLEWQRIASALGLVPPYPPETGWAEYEGQGILAIHQTGGNHPQSSVELNLLVEDLDGAENLLASKGYTVRRRMLDEGNPVVDVELASGAKLTLGSGAHDVHVGDVAVAALWLQEDFTEPKDLFNSLGLIPRIESDSGVWLEFSADGGGLAQLHASSESRQEATFEFDGTIDDLQLRVEEAGIEGAVIDEAYARTLRIPTPEGGHLQVNAKQTDLYGYTKLDA